MCIFQNQFESSVFRAQLLFCTVKYCLFSELSVYPPNKNTLKVK